MLIDPLIVLPSVAQEKHLRGYYLLHVLFPLNSGPSTYKSVRYHLVSFEFKEPIEHVEVIFDNAEDHPCSIQPEFYSSLQK
jgi:hypothetical protein